MIYLPPLRRFFLPSLALVTLIILYRALPIAPALPMFLIHSQSPVSTGIRVPVSSLRRPFPQFNASNNHLSPPNDYFYSYIEPTTANTSTSPLWQPALEPQYNPLFQCSKSANPYTGHIRLPVIIQNISQIPATSRKPESRIFWNPTIIALPYWSKNQYLVVSRIVTDGNHQENVLCEANVCYVGGSGEPPWPGEKPCTEEDLLYVGPAGGMRCVEAPVTLSVPPTPAEKCEGKFGSYVDIPGFHDPRIFWSGRGEPLMVVNTQSRYACFGLWIIDLRSLYPPLERLLASSPTFSSLGPLKSYPTLTELTRNPPSTRSAIEKNWLLFFPSSGESYVHYELPVLNSPSVPHDFNISTDTPIPTPRGRTFAKLLGNGLTTTNLTDPLEQPCLHSLTASNEPDPLKRGGTWHQATNSLRLILCDRTDISCTATPANTVFVALIHRKYPNMLKLPLRYERFFIVWAATPPFGMIGLSTHPILMANETASGWSPSHNWADNSENVRMVAEHQARMGLNASLSSSSTAGGKGYWAYFTYTVSISYAWGRKPRPSTAGGASARARTQQVGGGDEVADMHVGYLDDEVVLGIGIDDSGQGFARLRAGELVDCLRACPGRTERRVVA